MPTIHLTDGSRKKVDYSTAAKIKEMLDGTKEPESEAQAKFLEQISYVHFEPLPTANRFYRDPPKEHDTEIDKITNDKTLTGREKMKAVVERIRKRQRG